MQETQADDAEVTQKDGEQAEEAVEEQVEETTQTETEQTAETDDTDWKKEALKWKAIANRKKDKKPEVKSEVKPEASTSDLPQKDLIALIRANVSDDDISEVTDYAALKKVSIAEALKAPFVKTYLKEREEERKSAEVANTGGSRRSMTKVSDETLLRNFQTKGEVPDSKEDMDRLVLLRLKARRS